MSLSLKDVYLSDYLTRQRKRLYEWVSEREKLNWNWNFIWYLFCSKCYSKKHEKKLWCYTSESLQRWWRPVAPEISLWQQWIIYWSNTSRKCVLHHIKYGGCVWKRPKFVTIYLFSFLWLVGILVFSYLWSKFKFQLCNCECILTISENIFNCNALLKLSLIMRAFSFPLYSVNYFLHHMNHPIALKWLTLFQCFPATWTRSTSTEFVNSRSNGVTLTSDIKVPSAPHFPPRLLLLTIYYLLFTAFCWKFTAPVVNAANMVWFKQSAVLSYWIFF